MVKNTEGFNNNPQNRNNNPNDSNIIFINYEIMNPNKQNDQPENEENNIDSHSL